MKRLLKIALLFSAVVLYCCISGVYHPFFPASEKVSSHSTPKSDHSSMAAVDPFFHATLTENVSNGFSPLTFSQKNNLPYLQICRRVTALILLNRHTTYLFYARNIIDWFRPTDIIFPFHYFW